MATTPPSASTSTTGSPVSRTGLAASIILIALSALWFYREWSFESGVSLTAAIIATLAVFSEGLKQHPAFRRYDSIGMIGVLVLGAAGIGFFARDIFFSVPETVILPETVYVEENAGYFVRLRKCDDECEVYIGDRKVPVVEATFGEDSGWIDITGFLEGRETLVKVRVINSGGPIAYTFEFKKNNEIELIAGESCGTANSFGCKDDREYPRGIVTEYSYIFTYP